MSGKASILWQHVVTVMLASSMGNGTMETLNRHGIEVIRSCSGKVEQAVIRSLDGEFSDSGHGYLHHAHHN